MLLMAMSRFLLSCFLWCLLSWVGFGVGGLPGFSSVSFYLGNGAQGCRLFKLLVAECTRLTSGSLVGLGLLQPQMSSSRLFLSRFLSRLFFSFSFSFCFVCSLVLFCFVLFLCRFVLHVHMCLHAVCSRAYVFRSDMVGVT